MCVHQFCMSASAAACALSTRLNFGTPVAWWKAGNGDRVQGSADADVFTGLEVGQDGLVSGEKQRQEEGRGAFEGCCTGL